MLDVKELNIEGYENVIEAVDASAGLHAFIAVHNTSLGPSVGGTRIFPYANSEAALEDVLRLSRGMTYKSAMAEIGLGGGKSVIIADSRTQKNEQLLTAFAHALDTLQGKYLCAEDVGSTTEDMVVIRRTTPYVAALPTESSSGDPSPFTAWGCFRAIEAVADTLWLDRSVKGRRIAIQGLGAVGIRLAEFLFWQGAELIVCDIDPKRVEDAVHRFGARAVGIDNIYDVECDIFAPCAMGAAINSKTLPLLRCSAVAGSANNQLASEDLGVELQKRGILYAPDFVANAGGIINAAMEFESEGYSARIALEKIDRIYDSLRDIFEISEIRGMTPSLVANEIAESKIACGVGKREERLAR